MDKIALNALKLDKNEEYTLLIDPTIIEADKCDAAMTYKGMKG